MAPCEETGWRHRVPLLLLLLLVLIMANGVWGATIRDAVAVPDGVIHRPNYDFFIFYVAGQDWRLGLDPYASHGPHTAPLDFPFGADGAMDGYLYPPTMLPIYGALSRLPYDAARFIWLALNVGVFVGAIAVAAAMNRKRWLEIVTAAVLLTAVSYAFVHAIQQGQIDLFVSSITVLAFLLYGRRGDWPTAVLLALATLTKLMPVVVLLAMVGYYRDLALLGKAMLSIVAMVVLSFAFVDLGLYHSYFFSVLPIATAPDPQWNNLSALRFLSDMPAVAKAITMLGWLFLTLICSFTGTRSRAMLPEDRWVPRQTERYAVLLLSVTFGLFFSPLLWSMTMVWMIIPTALLLTAPPPQRRTWAPLLIGVGLLLSLAAPGVGPLASLHGIAAAGLVFTGAAIIFLYLPFGRARRPDLT